MNPCDHGMPNPAACIECMAEGNIAPPPIRPPEHATSRPFAARFPGSCPGCHTEIHEGEQVVYTDRERVLHEGCAS